MVTVALLSFIVLGLLAMFSQTQRAFRSSMTQVDVLENGRATVDLLQRELAEMVPGNLPLFSLDKNKTFKTNFNFIAELAPPVRLDASFTPVAFAQDLPGRTPPQQRFNILEQFCFLTRQNQQWRLIGYLVGTPTSGVGTLYRFEGGTNVSDLTFQQDLYNVQTSFENTATLLYKQNIVAPNLKRIADGVVDLRVRAYKVDGGLVTITNLMPSVSFSSGAKVRMNPQPATIQFQEPEYFFYSNAAPAAVELELGFLEDRVLSRFNSIPTGPAQAQYLQNHAAEVHIFRQRIPIANVDPAAYR
jgi:hypothetical protein